MIQEAESGDQGVERRGKGGEKEAREREAGDSGVSDLFHLSKKYSLLLTFDIVTFSLARTLDIFTVKLARKSPGNELL